MGHQYSCMRCRVPATVRYDITLPCNVTNALNFIERNPAYEEANHYLRGISETETRGTLIYCKDHEITPKLKATRTVYENGIFQL